MLLQHPELIAQAAKISLSCVEILAKRIADGQSKLALLLQKADEAIIREIAAAFEALSDAHATSLAATRDRLLTLAEANLYNATKLDPKLKTGDYHNPHWMAQAHYGLAMVYALRGDERMTARHTLRIFVSDPRLARVDLVPDL